MKTARFAALVLLTVTWVSWLVLPASMQTQIANNAAEMSGKIVMLADGATNRTVTNLFTFTRNPNPPFAVSSGSAKVTNLDADLLDGLDSTRLAITYVTTTSTGTQNNFNPGLNAGGGPSVIRANNASLLTITGFPAGIDGQWILVQSINAEVDFVHGASGSSVGNRLTNIVTTGSTPILLGSALFVYDAASVVWRLTQHEQGSFVTPAYAAGNYTANGSMTWTVQAGDVGGYAYYLKGHALTFIVALQGTTVGGTLNTQLLAKVPGGFTVATGGGRDWAMVNRTVDNSTERVGLCAAAAGATNVQFFTAYPSLATNWAASTDLTNIYCTNTIDVQ